MPISLVKIHSCFKHLHEQNMLTRSKDNWIVTQRPKRGKTRLCATCHVVQGVNHISQVIWTCWARKPLNTVAYHWRCHQSVDQWFFSTSINLAVRRWISLKLGTSLSIYNGWQSTKSSAAITIHCLRILSSSHQEVHTHSFHARRARNNQQVSGKVKHSDQRKNFDGISVKP